MLRDALSEASAWRGGGGEELRGIDGAFRHSRRSRQLILKAEKEVSRGI